MQQVPSEVWLLVQGGAHICTAARCIDHRVKRLWCCHDNSRNSCLGSMVQSRLPVSCTNPSYTHTNTHRADSAGAAHCSGHWQFTFLVVRCGESAAAERRCTQRLRSSAGTILIYIQCIDLPWLIMLLLYITGREKKIIYLVTDIATHKSQSVT